jgi:cytochrome c peroxidase
MHDGSLPTLLSVINHYYTIPAVVTGIDPRFSRPGGPGNPPQPQRLNLTTQQKTDLEAFLRTLTGSSIYTDEKFSPLLTQTTRSPSSSFPLSRQR